MSLKTSIKLVNLFILSGIDWQVKSNTSSRNFNKSVSSLLFLRGDEISQADVAPFQEKPLYASWVPPSHMNKVWSHPKAQNLYEKSAALLSNCQSPVRSLDHMVGNAWEMFASRAYVHHYLKHSLTEENFVDSFASLEQVIFNYKNM